jgi:lysozyme family protein
MINKYNEYLIEKQFQDIIDDILRIVENGTWTSDNTIEWDLNQPRTFEWDLTNDSEDTSILTKLKNLLAKLPKEKIKEYFVKLIDTIKLLPETVRRKLIINYAAIFLSFVSLNYLITDTSVDSKADSIGNKITKEIKSIDRKIKHEIITVLRKSDFNEAQKIVKTVEAGYSDDRGDTGNYYKGRFIGTNHGISAPILADYLGKTPTRSDMENLSYETALDIYKRDYWDAQNLTEFCDQSVANLIYDGCVNQGTTALRSIVRDAYIDNGIKITENDNPFSAKYIKKANALNQHKLFQSIKKGRENRYREARTFRRHGRGWLARLDNIEYNSDHYSKNT